MIDLKNVQSLDFDLEFIDSSVITEIFLTKQENNSK